MSPVRRKMLGQLCPNRAQARKLAARKPGAGKVSLRPLGREALHSGKRPWAADDAPPPNPLLRIQHPAVRADEGEVYGLSHEEGVDARAGHEEEYASRAKPASLPQQQTPRPRRQAGRDAQAPHHRAPIT